MGDVNNSVVAFPAIDLDLKRLKTADPLVVKVIDIFVPVLPSSVTNIDLRIAVAPVGQVYTVVLFVFVKSAFALL